jgi:hypothetical protein
MNSFGVGVQGVLSKTVFPERISYYSYVISQSRRFLAPSLSETSPPRPSNNLWTSRTI